MRNSYTLQQLAEYLDASYEGSAERQVTGIADLQSAQPESLSFVAKRKLEK